MRDLARALDYLWDPIANWPALTGDGQDVLPKEIHGGKKRYTDACNHAQAC